MKAFYLAWPILQMPPAELGESDSVGYNPCFANTTWNNRFAKHGLQGVCGCARLTGGRAVGGSPAEVKGELRQFRQNEEIVLQVICKKDATEKLEEKIPYGLAVTLEVAEESQISVYEKVRQRLSQQIEAQEEL